MNQLRSFRQQTRSVLLSILMALPLSAFAENLQPAGTASQIPTIRRTFPQPQIWLPDLMPVGFTSTYTGTSQYFREYSATVSVANLGTKDAGAFACLFGMRVLGTTDSVKYPVGSSSYVGWAIFNDGVEKDDMAQKTASLAFVIPKEVTHCEIVVVTDRFLDSLADPGGWEDDTGDELIGNILESNEQNNVSSPKTFRFLNLPSPVLRAQ